MKVVMMFMLVVGFGRYAYVVPDVYSSEYACNIAIERMIASGENYVVASTDRFKCLPIWVEEEK